MWEKNLSNSTALQRLGVNLSNKLTIDGVEQNVTTPSAIKPFQGKTWRAYGDSITGQGGNYGNGYVGYTSADQGTTTINQGKAGWVISQIADLLLADLPTADLITFTGGTNVASIGTIADTTTSTAYGALNSVATWILTNQPNTQLVFMTPIQLGESRTTARAIHVSDCRKAILEVAVKYSIPVLDWYAVSGITVETNTKYVADGIHPNDAGYRHMAAHLSKFLSGIVL